MILDTLLNFNSQPHVFEFVQYTGTQLDVCGRHRSVQTEEINSRTWKSLVARGEYRIEAKFQRLPPYYRCYPVHWKQSRCRGSHAMARAGKSHSRTWKSLATRAGNEIEPQFQLLPPYYRCCLYAETNADVVEVTPLSELEMPLQRTHPHNSDPEGLPNLVRSVNNPDARVVTDGQIDCRLQGTGSGEYSCAIN